MQIYQQCRDCIWMHEYENVNANANMNYKIYKRQEKQRTVSTITRLLIMIQYRLGQNSFYQIMSHL